MITQLKAEKTLQSNSTSIEMPNGLIFLDVIVQESRALIAHNLFIWQQQKREQFSLVISNSETIPSVGSVQFAQNTTINIYTVGLILTPRR